MPCSKTDLVHRGMLLCVKEAHWISVRLRCFASTSASHAGTPVAAAHSPASAARWPHPPHPLQTLMSQTDGVCEYCQCEHVPLEITHVHLIWPLREPP